jgi:hypothetical protein
MIASERTNEMLGRPRSAAAELPARGGDATKNVRARSIVLHRKWDLETLDPERDEALNILADLIQLSNGPKQPARITNKAEQLRSRSGGLQSAEGAIILATSSEP